MFFLTFSVFLALLLVLINLTHLSIKAPYHHLLFNSFNNLEFSFSLSGTSFLFLFMVMFVTSLVLVYSELYMELYNNKKFLVLLILFLSSMMILSLSDSFIMVMIGWDGLGVSSICLIMFYPNKVTQFNSFLTMTFNRIGDILLILVISWTLFNICDIASVFVSNWWITFLILICSFTKSAQFPTSAWLPAAMSAPTPISAMVHSSTLVTAGVYLMYKFFFYTSFWLVSNVLCLFSAVSFIMGGFMANLELDFKKVVAFSTMSQISMIMLFVSLALLPLAMGHMLFHAFFKTLLFCCSGILFINTFSDQSKKTFYLSSINLFYSFMFFVSIYSMSGLIFSSSFFSKDMVIENLLYETQFFLSVTLVVGSSLTLFYCSKLLDSSFSWANFMSSFLYKNMEMMFIFGFSAMVLFSAKFLKSIIMLDYFPIMDTAQIFIIMSALLVPCGLYSYFPAGSKFFYLLTKDVSLTKFVSFSQWTYPYIHLMKSTSYSDTLMVKSFYLKNGQMKFVQFDSNYFYMIVSITFMIMFKFL